MLRLLLCSLLALCFELTLGPACAEAGAVHHRVVRGEVQVRDGAFVTSSEAAEVEFDDGLWLRMEPGGSLRYFGKKQLWLDSTGVTRVHLLWIESGRVDVNVARAPTSVPAVVRTPHKLVGVIRGGRLGVHVGSNSAFAALSGDVQIARRSGWEPVSVGQLVLKHEGQSLAQAQPFAPRPTLGAARRVWSGIAGNARVEGFYWSHVPGASGYRFWVSNQETGNVEVEQRTERNVTAPGALALPAGSYELRVQAFDRFGFPGRVSEPLSFAVIGMVSSDESYVDDRGVVRVGSDRKVVFSHTAGLELTYGNAGRWVEAPPELFFRRTTRTVVRLRHPQAAGVVVVPVAPLSVRAVVRLGPKAAVWPRDQVQIAIQLLDSADGSAAARLKPNVEVHLGIQRMSLSWSRRGNVLTADVPAPTSPGPWVVRVTVELPSGRLLARGLLEVTTEALADKTNTSIVSSL